MDRKYRSRIIITLGILIAIGPFSVDAYLPGFPAIAADLETDIEHVALSLTSYFIGISLGQLLYGPLLDRFGRKKPLLIGLLIYIMATIGCAAAPSIHTLIALRFFQALGGCAGMVASRAVVRDIFSPHETAKVFSMMMLVMGAAPIIAPITGSFIVASIGWRAIFIMLLFVSISILIVVTKFLPETKEADPSVSFHPFKIIGAYFSLFKNKTFLIYAIASGSASAALFTYISDSAFVFITLFGVSESTFGVIYALNAFALISASQFNRLWLSKRTSRDITSVTLVLQFISSVVIIVFTAAGISHFLIMTAIFIYLFWLGFLNPNTTALALEPFTKNAGTASAMLGSFQMIFGAAAAALVSFFHDGTPMPMSVLLLCFCLLGLVAVYSAKLFIKHEEIAPVVKVPGT